MKIKINIEHSGRIFTGEIEVLEESPVRVPFFSTEELTSSAPKEHGPLT
jgi:hypothetical protein